MQSCAWIRVWPLYLASSFASSTYVVIYLRVHVHTKAVVYLLRIICHFDNIFWESFVIFKMSNEIQSCKVSEFSDRCSSERCRTFLWMCMCCVCARACVCVCVLLWVFESINTLIAIRLVLSSFAENSWMFLNRNGSVIIPRSIISRQMKFIEYYGILFEWHASSKDSPCGIMGAITGCRIKRQCPTRWFLHKDSTQTLDLCPLHGRLIQLLACSRDIKLYPIIKSQHQSDPVRYCSFIPGPQLLRHFQNLNLLGLWPQWPHLTKPEFQTCCFGWNGKKSSLL